MNAYVIPGIIKRVKVVKATERTKGEKIIKNICQYLDVPVDSIKCIKGKLEIVYAKQWCTYFLVQETKLALKDIGQLLGGRHHTSVMHNRTVVQDQLSSKVDNDYKTDYENVRRIIYNGIEEENINPITRKAPKIPNRKLERGLGLFEPDTIKDFPRCEAIYSNKRYV